MNALPAHRRAIAGRTWPSPWSPADMDPIERHRAEVTRHAAWAERAMYVLAGICLGAALAVHVLARVL